MTEVRIKEAIGVLKRYGYSTRLELSEGVNNDICDGISVSDFFDMKDLAVTALERQKAMAIHWCDDICPSCGYGGWSDNHLQGHEEYCCNCGQKLEWVGVKEEGITMGTQEIKPCPFCGEQVGLRYSLGRALIGCSNKKCKIQPSTWLLVKTDKVSELVKIWNKRYLDE